MIWLGPGLTVPEELTEKLSGYRARGSFQGDDASTFRLEREGRPTLYLQRRADPDEQQPLAVERFVLHRLTGRGLPTARPEQYVRFEDTEYLLLSALPGRNLVESIDEGFAPQAAVEVVAAAIARIHATAPTWPEDINAVPFRIELARSRVRAGQVDPDGFPPRFEGLTPERAFREFERRWSEPQARVFVHGDLCLPNVLVADGALSGLVDWSRAGYGDAYQDLALAVRSLGRNLGPGDWRRRLAEACGIPELDDDQLELWMLFDALF